MEKGLSRARTEREVGGIGDTLAEPAASKPQVGKEIWVLTGLCRSEQVAHSQTSSKRLCPSSRRGSVNSRKDVSPDGTSPGQRRDIPKSQG